MLKPVSPSVPVIQRTMHRENSLPVVFFFNAFGASCRR
jgi:hypothetical protein